MEADVRFHRAVAAAAHNSLLAELYEQFGDALREALAAVVDTRCCPTRSATSSTRTPRSSTPSRPAIRTPPSGPRWRTSRRPPTPCASRRRDRRTTALKARARTRARARARARARTVTTRHRRKTGHDTRTGIGHIQGRAAAGRRTTAPAGDAPRPPAPPAGGPSTSAPASSCWR
ncbi:FCD domain-containing protein [Streptomyces noursei]|nr:FCD domain-containing protein [Streptomyces noursei]